MDAISKISEFQKFGWVLGLERMNVLLEKLGNPHEDIKLLHFDQRQRLCLQVSL